MLVFSSLYNALALTQRPGIIWSRKKYHSRLSLWPISPKTEVENVYGSAVQAPVSITARLKILGVVFEATFCGREEGGHSGDR